MDIKNNLSTVLSELPKEVKLIAVSKTKPIELLQQVYDAGQRVFGENRAQELKQKYDLLPKDIEWHFIGHPQSKQVKYFSQFVSLIHGVDGLKLLSVINKEAIKHNRVIDCLLQFHIAQEQTKFGLNLEEATELLKSSEFLQLKNIRICGVMGMATYTDDSEQIKSEFINLKSIFDTLKSDLYLRAEYFNTVSMGMSGDYKLAVSCGSNMVRVGSRIFGARK